MTLIGWAQIALVLACVLAAAVPLGRFIARVAAGERTFLQPVLGPVERGIYAAAGVAPEHGQGWKAYTLSMLAFSAAGFASLYALLRLQGVLPFNPQGFPGMSPYLAFNTAVSFVTNTNWQAYCRRVRRLLPQPDGRVHRAQLPLGSYRHRPRPGAVAGLRGGRAQGPRQFLGRPDARHALRPAAARDCRGLCLRRHGHAADPRRLCRGADTRGRQATIALGPVAFQIAIKHLGTNGGGFFGANAPHPFEGPSALATAVQIWCQAIIPFGLCVAFGAIVGDRRQGWVLLSVMLGFVLAATAAIYAAEAAGNPLHLAAGVDPALGNMEGKDVRFGQALVALFTATTTGASCGAVNAMFDSFTPLGGLVPLFLIQLGEVLPGGVGSGLYGMLVFVLLAVFVAGLMVGRTPEYLGKKVQAREVKLAMLAVLVLPASILGFAAVSMVLPAAIASVANQGPHGLSEMLYAYTSATGNNGSAFGGLTADTPWLDTTLGLAMLLGRFAYVVPVMASRARLRPR